MILKYEPINISFIESVNAANEAAPATAIAAMFNKDFNTYKGATYEKIIADILVKQGCGYFYKNNRSTLEMDFFMRDDDSLIPVEVKANDGATVALNKLIDGDKYYDIKYGIKLGYKNIGFNGDFYTFPYFLTFC